FHLCSALIVVLTPFLSVTTASFDLEKALAAGKQTLPVVGSFAQLKALLKKELADRPTYYYSKAVTEAGPRQEAVPASAAVPATGHSTTNVQVEGVDEADIVKTDGTYIYQADNQQ
ncbi:beta-propeller domain-containing protein, partial [Frankia sp. Cpl3]|nr:beta-propeller domain-containing protein [Frankia sp. Cpl3]